MRRDDELLAGWKPTGAPPDVAERVVSTAARGGRTVRPRRLDERLWHSRGLRFGWLAATTALLLLNLWMPAPETDGHRGMNARDSATHDDDDLRPSWSDQEMLLCKVLNDCATADEQTIGGQA
jgi:hypothetical protein